MATRRSKRRGGRGRKKGGSNMTVLGVIAGAVLVLAAVLGSGVLKKSGVREAEPETSFRIADYRRDGSRFASAGNTYVFDGRVENIETIDNNRIVSISIPDNPDERLPLLVPGNVRLRTNLTRGDRFIFETTCTTGKAQDGSQVKGILIVRNAQSR